MHTLYSVAQVRAIEAAGQITLPPGTLMERAGRAASALALAMLAARPGPVLVLAGPGNNGGDALEVAANLAAGGVAVTVIHLAGATPSFETARALQRARARAVRFVERVEAAGSWVLAIDGLFGIGLARAIDGAVRALVDALNDAGRPVLALDVPSGLDADTGAVLGLDGAALRATHTITFIGDKPGLHTFAGRDHAGQVSVADLDIDPAMFPPPEAQLAAPPLFAHCLRARAHASHKGSFGDVAILGGAQGMAGAALLAGRASLYAGAGRVFVALIDPAIAVDSLHPELMLRAADGFDKPGATLVAGPGMGNGPVAAGVLLRALERDAPLVLDADALNLLAARPELQARLAVRAAPAILTPHPLEAARLLGLTAALVQADRLAAARELAERLQAVVVLKGSGSIIARPDGTVVINPTGNPGLATAGTGDVLAGLCGSLLAQGWPAWEAAIGAVWLHGAAADHLVEQGVGPIGMTAGELPAAIRTLLNRLAKPA